MKKKKFSGNLVSRIEAYLLYKLKAKKVDFISNNIDEAYHVYKVQNTEITVHIEERLFEDVTTVSSTDKEIIDDLKIIYLS